MNKYIIDIINETLEEVNTWNSPAASFGAGAAMGIFIKHLNEIEEHLFDQGFDEGLECAENVIMYANHDFVKKMFPEEPQNYNVFDLVAKYGIREVNKKYLEYKDESGRERQMDERQN